MSLMEIIKKTCPPPIALQSLPPARDSGSRTEQYQTVQISQNQYKRLFPLLILGRVSRMRSIDEAHCGVVIFEQTEENNEKSNKSVQNCTNLSQ